MNRDLLTEAIADAKAVKEMAIANAKAALEEAFTPHLKSMLSQKLQEMDEAEDDDIDLNTDADFEREQRNQMAGRMEEAYDDSMEEVEEGMDKEKMDEMDLEEILAELEKDEMSEAEDKDSLKEEEDFEMDLGDVELEDMTEEQLKDLIEDVIEDMVAAGELEAGEKFGDNMEDEEIDLDIEDDEAGEEMEEEGEEVSIDELLSEMEYLDEEEELEEGLLDFLKKKKTEAPKTNKPAATLVGVDWDGNYIYSDDPRLKEMKKKDKELEEAYDAVATLRSELQEVNLLNSKLLYTNKIFRSKNLTESQKVKVLSTFDKAETVKEVKLVYETLGESLKAKNASPIKESLGRASKPTGNAPKRQILESNDAFARMQKLAGIIK